MTTTAKIIRYELRDVLRSRSLIAYALFFLLVMEALLRFGDGAKAAVSLMNIVLLLIPLVSVVFGTMYLYGAREFTELLLAQPVHRAQLFAGTGSSSIAGRTVTRRSSSWRRRSDASLRSPVRDSRPRQAAGRARRSHPKPARASSFSTPSGS